MNDVGYHLQLLTTHCSYLKRLPEYNSLHFNNSLIIIIIIVMRIIMRIIIMRILKIIMRIIISYK